MDHMPFHQTVFVQRVTCFALKNLVAESRTLSKINTFYQKKLSIYIIFEKHKRLKFILVNNQYQISLRNILGQPLWRIDFCYVKIELNKIFHQHMSISIDVYTS